MRSNACRAAAFLLTALSLSTAASGQVTVSPVAEDVTIVRETPAGRERLVYLSISNPGNEALTRLKLDYAAGGRKLSRDLLDVPPGGAWDTLWLPEPAPRSLSAQVTQAGATLWRGTIAVPPVKEKPVVIPRSRLIRAADLKPLTLRGANYYPRSNPWPGLWRAMGEKGFESEFAEIARLNVNTIRTFYIADPDTGLHRKDGTFTPLLLSRIDTLLRVADRHHMKVMLCLMGGGGAPLTDLTYWRRYFRTGIEPFVYDGRVLMWDLMNEPGGNDGPNAKPELARWLQMMYAYLKQLDSHHLNTVGLCWQFDQLWALGIKPDAGQYHNYSGAVGMQPAGQPPVRNVADDLRAIRKDYTGDRPLIIGEFGLYSETGEEKSDEERRKALDHQADIYRWVLEGAEAARITGVYNWIAFQFTPTWMGRKEQTFGVILPDGSLKPSGVLLRDTYARWRRDHPAVWE